MSKLRIKLVNKEEEYENLKIEYDNEMQEKAKIFKKIKEENSDLNLENIHLKEKNGYLANLNEKNR